jgi:valyl-tRNA synthetase
VRAIRNLRTEKKVTPGRRIPATIAAGERLPIFQQQAKALCALAYIDPQGFTLVSELKEKPQDQVVLTVSGVEIYLPLAGLVDFGAERARLRSELSEVEGQIQRLEALLAGPFGEKAPPAVVEKERQKLIAWQETAARLREQLNGLG